MNHQLATLLEIPKEYQEINSRISNINRGGCAIFAHALLKCLKKLRYNAKAVSIGPIHEVDPDKAISILKEKKLKITARNLSEIGCSLYHVVVEVKVPGDGIVKDTTVYMDSNGTYNDPTQLPHYENFNISARFGIKECGLIANHSQGWNCMFDRNSIPKIHAYLAETLAPKKIRKIFG